MKKIVVLVIAVCFMSATNVYAHKMKHKAVTVDQVKEYRTLVLERMNTRLESGELTEEQNASLTKRIASFEARPLPTQEQIDKRHAQKRKAWKKRKFRHKRKA